MTENKKTPAAVAAAASGETGTIDDSSHLYSTKRKPVCQSGNAWADYCLRWEIQRMRMMAKLLEERPDD